MKRRFFAFFSAAMLIITVSSIGQVSAQSAAVVDSAQLLKQNKKIAELNLQIIEKKEKLAKLESSLNKKMDDKKSSDVEAQQSADNNARAASKLTDDATDKKLSRKARKAAKEAEGDAKSARRDSRELESVQKDVESLRKKIAEDEAKLAKLQAAAPQQ